MTFHQKKLLHVLALSPLTRHEICVKLDVKPSVAWKLIEQLQVKKLIEEKDGKMILTNQTGSVAHTWDFRKRSAAQKRIGDNIAKIKMMLEQGNTIKRVAQLYNVSQPTLSKYLKP